MDTFIYSERIEHQLVFGYPILWIVCARDDDMAMAVAHQEFIQIIILVNAVH
jgi:hypothetical protein